MTFIVIFLGHTYVTYGTLNPLETIELKPVPESAVAEVNMYRHGRKVNQRWLSWHGMKRFLSTPMLAHRVGEWPPDVRDFQSCCPYFMSCWSHFSLPHLVASSQALLALMPQMYLLFDLPRAVTSFVACGLIATALECTADRAYASGKYAKYFRYLKQSPRPTDDKRALIMRSYNVGASGALCGLWTIIALQHRKLDATFSAFLITTLACFWADRPRLPKQLRDISHSGHLAGFLSGAVVWSGWLRWSRQPRGIEALMHIPYEFRRNAAFT